MKQRDFFRRVALRKSTCAFACACFFTGLLPATGNDYPDQREAALAQSEEVSPVADTSSVLGTTSPVTDVFELPTDEFNPDNEPSVLQDPTFSDGTTIPIVPTDNPVPDTPLYRLAYRVISSVGLLRAYDEFGIKVAQAAGFLISDDGKIMTDGSLLTKASLGKVVYITLTDAKGGAYTVKGILDFEPKTNVLILQSDFIGKSLFEPEKQVAAVPPERPLPIAIIALDEKRGLVLADGSLLPDEGLPGDSWMTINGNNSPGTVGSPVLDLEGNFVGMVGLQLHLKHWFSFAQPIQASLTRLARLKNPPVPVDRYRLQRPVSVMDDPRFAEAMSLLNDGAWRSAGSRLAGLLLSNPRSSELWTLLGYSFCGSQKNDLALAAFRRAAALDPDKGYAWYGLAVSGLASAKKGVQSESDVEALEKFAAYDSSNGMVWKLLAERYLATGQTAKASEACRQATSILGQHPALSYLTAKLLALEGKLEESRSAINQCIAQDRKNANYCFFSGLLFSRKGDQRAAVEAYKTTVQLRPNHPLAWMNLSRSQLMLGNRTEARISQARHLALKPE